MPEAHVNRHAAIGGRSSHHGPRRWNGGGMSKSPTDTPSLPTQKPMLSPTMAPPAAAAMTPRISNACFVPASAASSDAVSRLRLSPNADKRRSERTAGGRDRRPRLTNSHARVGGGRYGVNPHRAFDFVALRGGPPALIKYELANLADVGSAGSRASTAIR
jgi:hypothetical protein